MTSIMLFDFPIPAFWVSPAPHLLTDAQWLAVLASTLILLYLSPKLFRLFKPRAKWRVKHSKKIHRRLSKLASSEEKRDLLKELDPYLFEELVLTAYEQQGQRVRRNRRYSGDGGIDGMVWLKGKCHFVQSKLYTGYIKRRHLEEFDQLCRHRRVRGVFVYTGLLNSKLKQHFKHISIISFDELLG